MRTPLYYVLDEERQPLAIDDVVAWGDWFATSKDRQIADDKDEDGGDVRVSTVFLGLDHNFGASGPPILYETMVFGGPYDGSQERYATRDDAIAGHQRWCSRVSAATAKGSR